MFFTILNILLLLLSFFTCWCLSLSGIAYLIVKRKNKVKNLIVFIVFATACILLTWPIHDSIVLRVK